MKHRYFDTRTGDEVEENVATRDGVLKNSYSMRIPTMFRDAATGSTRGDQPGDLCTIDGWPGRLRMVSGKLQCVSSKSQDASPLITDGYGDSGLALQRPGYRLRTDSDGARQRLADAYDRAERVQNHSYKLHDGESLCPDCSGLGEDADGFPCETCHGSGVMPAVEDDKGKDKRGTPKHFGSGNHSTDRRTLDQMTHDHQTNMAKLRAQHDFELSQQWRGK